MNIPYWLSLTVIALSLANLIYLVIRRRASSARHWAIATSVIGFMAGAVTAGLDSGTLPRTTPMQAISTSLIFAFVAALVITSRVQGKEGKPR
jgi:hypothetical protein